MGDREETPSARVPPRLGRPARFGPFPSAHAALQFITYAAASALLLPLLAPWLWAPGLLVGFLLAVLRPGGESVEGRVARAIRWRGRLAFGGEDRVLNARARRSGASLRLASGRAVGIVRTPAVPLAYRPPVDLADAFRSYLTVLRGLDSPLACRAHLVRISSESLVPHPDGEGSADAMARDGYRELVEVLCRRRSRRLVDWALLGDPTGPREGLGAEAVARRWAARLAEVGLEGRALLGRRLRDAAIGFGWRTP